MIRKDECSDFHIYELVISHTFNWGFLLEKVLPDVMGGFGVWAEKIVEYTNVNFSTRGSKLPPREVLLDRGACLSCRS